MQMRLDPIRTLSLCLVCIVGLACSSTSNEGGACGGLAGIQCTADEYCDYSNNQCGSTDGAAACPDIFSPTCACDGEVYSSACDAAAHGFDVSANGCQE